MAVTFNEIILESKTFPLEQDLLMRRSNIRKIYQL